MSTRSIIGILNSDGTATYVFCHWDGYPAHHAPLLLEHYNTEDRVRQLLAQGQIEVLDKYISPEEVIGELEPAHKGLDVYNVDGWKHTDLTRAKDVCSFILRDCDITHWSEEEKETSRAITAPLKEFGDKWGGQEYDYLFKNGEWYFRGKRWTKLTKKHYDIN